MLAIALLGAGACANAESRTVIVLGPWTGTEETDFRRVLARFTAVSGIDVDYRGTRAVEQVLAHDLQRGAPPDVAVLPNPGILAAYARRSELRPLNDVVGDQSGSYSPQWLRLQEVGQDQRFAVAVKVDVKGAFWYRTENPGEVRPPDTWGDLVALSERMIAAGHTPWCLGMGSPPTSGWPGTDWIEVILLRSAGAEAYREWASGKRDWTSTRDAWATWGALVTKPGAVRGGTRAALLTDFGDAGKHMFTSPPGCLMEHRAASSAVTGYQAMQADEMAQGQGVDFFQMPGATTLSVSADLAGMFSDSHEAKELIRFLASDGGQRAWPELSGGTVFSANSNVTDVYDDNPITRRIAVKLNSDPLCFDASDLMPTQMTEAFHRAVLEYLHDPTRLDRILADLDKVRESLSASDQWLDTPCGQ
ncbi:ABC transporter substrate-binding protein [Actinokineospora sp. UTMC 2448]|uniref:ABC transporter substrate-binding protein n=1 Tax=Actinokineospora sp. UTMC 2448 TaxID=2268449 RepID=UPI0021644090|nr:ABC transporter substrate-binding protein [Actinokineospora sp. UTMC 2448]